MKSYIIRIELEGSEPLVWRKVVMPAGATFNMLHDIIQQVSNFQSGYPYEPYHLFEFDLPEEGIRVTNDEQAYEEHQYYKKNKKLFAERLKNAYPKHKRFEENYQKRLATVVRQPARIKIDEYIEKLGQLIYRYDFGGDWRFRIILEEIVYDYHFGFPTLLAGEEAAPPEDVGGLPGFYEFLKIYRDEQHPEHEDMKTWAADMRFREYDPKWINSFLKSRMYKKTEWNKIHHENYQVIEDKYRKTE
ncbi:plasmid pRiA4b ORF-3 family protein [Planococcus sp. CP5-4]|uniref:plasmid pRiA4b ORF-3 family protein n=1 Tax=unclassified Planococcus (in: firmicutes) TaxID=2662419 RepID=UPI001C24F244|nr:MULTISPECIES: plasmid pRiA4b ORF-3 family protein [unclassified Planococcus (in: firmicutes)]MBU9673804.1 plasmid pRiA4b ORF-3 family protein [Planococcus sp. CP5-4_YE]MBV0908932.1 plasmid pRiA4b ORF-3 family protein [Planococcus sp. CP5-4_UN]MBW6063981.1 plasmid pRiA4b ORF-3 family protein [Planococcus sp. CP5-4]